MKRTFFSVFVMVVALMAANSVSYAQNVQNMAEFDKNMELMRKDLRSGKKQVIAANLPLTDVEATKFWPIYDAYVGEMSKQYDQFYGIIKDYAANQKTLTDVQALDMIKKWTALQAEQVKIKQKYITMVEKAITGKKTALFFQLDRRLYAIIDLQIASEVPLVLQ